MHGFNPRSRRAPVQPFQQGTELRFSPFRLHFHIPRRGIPYPAGNAQALGFGHTGVAETNALNASLHTGIKRRAFAAFLVHGPYALTVESACFSSDFRMTASLPISSGFSSTASGFSWLSYEPSVKRIT